MCDHKTLYTVNGVLFCAQCGAELPLEYLSKQSEKPVKSPKKGKRTKKEE